jgi:Ala-tRNA(Pro) deacylase
MPVAERLRRFLQAAGAEFALVRHPPAATARAAARAAHVPEERTAKAVLVGDDAGYVVAVLPATRRIALDALGAFLHRDVTLSGEADLSRLFGDCEPGTMPGVGRPYGLPTVVDESLFAAPDLYLESGNRGALVHLRASEFLRLIAGAPRASFTILHESAAAGR